MIVRRLNDTGIERLEEFLNSLRTETPQEIPLNILSDPSTSEAIGIEIKIDVIQFNNRYHAAEYLFNLFLNSDISNIEHDKGLWAWLSLLFFEQLCPKNKEGNYDSRDLARLIPDSSNFRKYYRHLLAGPYRIYRAHSNNPECTLALLCNPLNKPGDVAETFASRQELVTNEAILETATFLYVNKEKQVYRKGAQNKRNGGARRLNDVFNQFDTTWDLYSMPSETLIELLPQEFDKFINH